MRLLITLAWIAMAVQGQTYLSDVFPIWERHCLGCHASGTNMGSLDLETWEGLQRGGNHGTILVPGDLKASRLYTMLIGEGQPAMPMDGKVLSPSEIATVRNWISNGAPPPSPAEIALLRQRSAGEANPVHSLAWRPRTGDVAVGRATAVDLMNPKTDRVSNTLEGHGDVVRWLAFSSDGRRLATAGRRQTSIWNLATNSVTAKIPASGPIALSPDGQWLATAGAQIQLWVADTGRPARTLSSHSGAWVAFAQQRLFASIESTVIVWNALTGQRLYSIDTGNVTSAALSPDGRKLASANETSLSIWELADSSAKLLCSTNQRASALAWSPDGTRIATAGETPKLYRADSLLVLRTLPGPTSSLAFSPDGAVLVTSDPTGILGLWPQ